MVNVESYLRRTFVYTPNSVLSKITEKQYKTMYGLIMDAIKVLNSGSTPKVKNVVCSVKVREGLATYNSQFNPVIQAKLFNYSLFQGKPEDVAIVRLMHNLYCADEMYFTEFFVILYRLYISFTTDQYFIDNVLPKCMEAL